MIMTRTRITIVIMVNETYLTQKYRLLVNEELRSIFKFNFANGFGDFITDVREKVSTGRIIITGRYNER